MRIPGEKIELMKRLYADGVSCVEIHRKLFPDDKRYNHLKRISISRALQRAEIKTRTPHERTMVGYKTRKNKLGLK